MCSPEVALGSQILGAANSAIGAFFGAASQKSALKSSARIDDINATIDDAQARAALMASEKTQAAIGLRGAQTKSTQMAGFAGNGIDVGSSSAVNVYTSTDYVTQLDKNQAEANGIAAAWGHRISADNLRSHANNTRVKASSIDPLASATNSLIGSSGQVASSWYKLDSQGAFGKGGTGDNGSSGKDTWGLGAGMNDDDLVAWGS